MEEDKRAYLDKYDIMRRYDVGMNKALCIMRGIQEFNGGGALGKGRILRTELEYWEANRGVKTERSVMQ